MTARRLSKAQQAALDFLALQPSTARGRSAVAVAAALDMSLEVAVQTLASLVRRGLVERDLNRSGRLPLYTLSETT